MLLAQHSFLKKIDHAAGASIQVARFKRGYATRSRFFKKDCYCIQPKSKRKNQILVVGNNSLFLKKLFDVASMWKISQPRMLGRCGLEKSQPRTLDRCCLDNIQVLWKQYYPTTLSSGSSHNGICDNRSRCRRSGLERLVLFVPLPILGLSSDPPVV